jgi:hypothetical protein
MPCCYINDVTENKSGPKYIRYNQCLINDTESRRNLESTTGADTTDIEALSVDVNDIIISKSYIKQYGKEITPGRFGQLPPELDLAFNTKECRLNKVRIINKKTKCNLLVGMHSQKTSFLESILFCSSEQTIVVNPKKIETLINKFVDTFTRKPEKLFTLRQGDTISRYGSGGAYIEYLKDPKTLKDHIVCADWFMPEYNVIVFEDVNGQIILNEVFSKYNVELIDEILLRLHDPKINHIVLLKLQNMYLPICNFDATSEKIKKSYNYTNDRAIIEALIGFYKQLKESTFKLVSKAELTYFNIAAKHRIISQITNDRNQIIYLNIAYEGSKVSIPIEPVSNFEKHPESKNIFKWEINSLEKYLKSFKTKTYLRQNNKIYGVLVKDIASKLFHVVPFDPKLRKDIDPKTILNAEYDPLVIERNIIDGPISIEKALPNFRKIKFEKEIYLLFRVHFSDYVNIKEPKLLDESLYKDSASIRKLVLSVIDKFCEFKPKIEYDIPNIIYSCIKMHDGQKHDYCHSNKMMIPSYLKEILISRIVHDLSSPDFRLQILRGTIQKIIVESIFIHTPGTILENVVY